MSSRSGRPRTARSSSSTGSIGRSTLDVIESDGSARLRAHGLSAHSNGRRLAEQARSISPRFIAVTDAQSADEVCTALRGTDVEVLTGVEGVIRMVQDPATDRVLNAIVGAAGLNGTWAALEAGKTGVTAHFTSPPFSYVELDDPKIHRVLNSVDLLGNITLDVVFAPKRFTEANPKLMAAFLAALDAADAFIEGDKEAAADIFVHGSPVKVTKEEVRERVVIWLIENKDFKIVKKKKIKKIKKKNN